ncbi:Tc5 transposase DNA-binding domain [Popillia japonica]|uniref:Tc5 transposase DNA-binding domain n=1 Tax=Popillia japonica TaxID=7064 RepID=A0AAW1N3W6_POPJA
MQCQTNKRKRVVISLQEKLKAVRRLDNGDLLKNIANDLGVGVRTVAEWRKNREKLEKWCSVLSSPTPARKSMKRGEYEKVDDSLFLWFTQNRERGIPTSGTILKQKAMSLSEELRTRLLLDHILEEVDEGANLTECLKKLNLKNVVYWIASAWNQVKGRTLEKSWSKFIQHEEGRITEGDHEESLQQIFTKIPGCENVTETEANEWLNSDNVEDEMTRQELIESVRKNVNEISSDDDDEVEYTDNIPVKCQIQKD